MKLDLETLELLLDNIGCGVFTVDNERRITSWNRSAAEITGFPASAMLGKRCCSLKCLNCVQGTAGEAEDCQVFREGNTGPQECVLARADGTTVRVLKSGRLLYDKAGNLLGAVESLTDISSIRTEFNELFQDSAGLQESAPVPGMIGLSEQMRQVYRLVRFAAESESTVLVTGESGTGKELVARAVHALGRRHSGPFVAVNCSALPETLLESELFGHVKGAFSGAVANKVGRFELAAGGTVFLDEIGDISPLIQLKLLRILQNREYQRVGESASRTAEVRVIAATNKDLLQAVRRGEFREDLFFRLKVFPIAIPPLRDRKSDISELVRHFITEFNRKTGKRISLIKPEAMKLLLEYCWPGNVRELEHAIEYAFVLIQNEELGPFELPQEILRMEFRKQFCPPGQQNFLIAADSQAAVTAAPSNHRGQPGRSELLQALQQYGWNQSAAARHYGVSRVTIWSWMKKLGITKPSGG